ncbi:hypothetical protein CHLNCDRAFT_142820 [Chlorella variabilis]|uniref:Uncharacterized protein n=1 Tax=Chlorella variabilis TaxID=554065 RepID=E1Z8U1_CHLVA|nr:hypothetical protein CHLNCDRAFT_142820 [Chlorella variabilis]EFN57666.1 hypothetical protein CHLNCDRAFT_142820 [Chlorella variabilis]|eukprot:XP_005849768.1 hypothetical protein CHLNCDRAFT_142820 [Chlorella variabilis]
MAGGGGLPWQVRAFAGGGEGRMPAYKVAMVLGVAGVAWWYYSANKELAKKQDQAVDKFGRHGEKVDYGDPATFKASVQGGEHFPGLPDADTNAAGGHAGGAKTP